MYMYVCMYVCMYIYIYIYMYSENKAHRDEVLLRVEYLVNSSPPGFRWRLGAIGKCCLYVL